MPWFGRRLKAGDRYDICGIVVGLIVFVVLGIVLEGASRHHPAAGWLISFAIGAGITNVTSFILRRTVGPGPPSATSGADRTPHDHESR